MLALANSLNPPGLQAKSKREVYTVKPCLHCDKPHTHSNAYYSAECCKEHRNGN